MTRRRADVNRNVYEAPDGTRVVLEIPDEGRAGVPPPRLSFYKYPHMIDYVYIGPEGQR